MQSEQTNKTLPAGEAGARIIISVLLGIFFAVVSIITYRDIGGLESVALIALELLIYVMITWLVVWKV